MGCKYYKVVLIGAAAVARVQGTFLLKNCRRSGVRCASLTARRPSDVGHKLLLGKVCPLAMLSAVENVPVVNECRLDGRTDGIHVGCRF